MSASLYLPTHCDLERLVLWGGAPHAMAFRLIPPGRFRMGSRNAQGWSGHATEEEPAHWVEITRAFWMAETPVTQGQYRFMAGQCLADLEKIEGNKGAEPSHFKGDDQRPVENVNWHEAGVIAAWVKAVTGKEARLPTEAEWEYACRAGTTTEYHTGDGEAALDLAGWYGGNAGGTTHPVAQQAMNTFGLRDMHGNVWEWCQDAWDEQAYQKRLTVLPEECPVVLDPCVQVDTDSPRVIRGGSWIITAWYCRSAIRDRLHPGNRNRFQGFRLCLSSGPVENSQPGAGGQPEAEPVEGAGGSGADARATGAGGAVRGGWQGLKPPRSGRNFSPET